MVQPRATAEEERPFPPLTLCDCERGELSRGPPLIPAEVEVEINFLASATALTRLPSGASDTGWGWALLLAVSRRCGASLPSTESRVNSCLTTHGRRDGS